MAKNLVIVESPAKAKTIQRFLGKDFSVLSSFGHIRDLPSKGMSIDIENEFTPEYQVSPDKKKVVSELKTAAKKADTVWLASDEDREGEAIAWHLKEALQLKDAKTKRIVFHEITKPAIEHAVANPRQLDSGLVDAQQARRVLDRLVGYELSPVLWKKVQRGLSAGRVQSVAVRLIVEREREIGDFEAASSFKLKAEFIAQEGSNISAEHPSKLDGQEEAAKILAGLTGARFSISDVTQKPGKRSPSSPFTTSTLQQEASRKLGYSVRQTMVLAQRLYESGKITYMRTDSVNLSQTALKNTQDAITSRYGSRLHKKRQFKTKSASAQEAHEAIRPTNMDSDSEGVDAQQQKLYRLIWQRTMASQMIEAIVEKTVITIENDKDNSTNFQAKGEVLTEPGWLTVYPNDRRDSLLPPLKVGENLDVQQIMAEEQFTRPPSRYTEAGLVKKLEELGIGRPSTYAPTISTIQDRGYIEKKELEGKKRTVRMMILDKSGSVREETRDEITGADKNKLTPTDTAGVVTDFLSKYFEAVVDYDFTAKIETQFDKIAEGKEAWQKMIHSFYGPFHQKVEAAEGISRKEAGGMRKLGVDPKSKRPVYARVGRYGPMVQIGEAEDEEKPRFAPMPADQTMQSVSLEQALEMFALPRTVGKTSEGEDIIANVGRFGPYVKVGNMFVSIKPEDPFTIDEERANEFIVEKRKAEANKHIKTFDEDGIQVLNGRYGPYVTDGSKNAKIPKDADPKKLTLEDAKELIEKAPARKKRAFRAKKK